ncbi:MAG TPA: hypothetical protein VEQ42_09055, partial [Pyrinomonadaceae bacterium]|nr:hypothetical protein [Pyrinomonadaceae bacterium]
AGVAGRIYRALNQRFGTRGAPAPMLANTPLAPRPKIDPRTAAAISDEDKEKDEADAYVVSEAQQDGDDSQQGAAPRSPVRATMQPSPARTTTPDSNTRPAIRPSISTPQQAPSTQPGVNVRPRRVNENNQ